MLYDIGFMTLVGLSLGIPLCKVTNQALKLYHSDRRALPGENQVKSGAGVPAIGSLMHNW